MDAKENILVATEDLIRENGVHGTTFSDIAARATCAKGLISYHFGTKTSLIGLIADRVLQQRIEDWQTSLSSSDPNDAIDKSWRLLRSEADSGTLKLWSETVEYHKLTEQSVRTRHETFAAELGGIASTTLGHAGLRSRIPLSELGNLLAAVVHGIGKMLRVGLDPIDLEGAYAAAWLGMLSLTQD